MNPLGGALRVLSRKSKDCPAEAESRVPVALKKMTEFPTVRVVLIPCSLSTKEPLTSRVYTIINNGNKKGE